MRTRDDRRSQACDLLRAEAREWAQGDACPSDGAWLAGVADALEVLAFPSDFPDLAIATMRAQGAREWREWPESYLGGFHSIIPADSIPGPVPPLEVPA